MPKHCNFIDALGSPCVLPAGHKPFSSDSDHAKGWSTGTPPWRIKSLAWQVEDVNGRRWEPCNDPTCPDFEHPEDLHSHEVIDAVGKG